MDITSAASALRAGSLTSRELVEDCLERVYAHNDTLHALVAVYAQSALAAADAADRELASGIDRGVLHGIPIAIKDVIATREGPTRGGGHAWDDDWHPGDARTVARVRDAGAIIIGKTLTMEFAVGMPDKRDATVVTSHPLRAASWAGGSSSGSGAGVSAGMFFAGIGTDTGGSIRCPSSYCGVTGIKPSHGLVPVEGMITWAPSLDHVGPIALTARDCRAMLEAMAPGGVGASRVDPAAALPLANLRIGVERAHHLDNPVADPALTAVFERAVQVLADAGAEIVEVELPHMSAVADAAMLITPAEGYAYHRDNLRARWHDYGTQTRVQIAAGAMVSSADLTQAYRFVARVREQVAGVFGGLDAIVVPTTATVAPDIENLYGADLRRLISDTIYTPYWDVMGNPAISVPMGTGEKSLPLGLQIISGLNDDRLALDIGEVFQDRTDFIRPAFTRPALISAAAGIAGVR